MAGYASNAVVPFGTKYGVLPGSDTNTPYGPMYKGVYSMMAPPDPMLGVQVQGALAEQDRASQKFDIWKSLFGKMGGMFGSGSGSASYRPANIPAPQYISAGPVWSQQQINAQSNMQRANLLTQANNSSRQYTQGLASRGFSPLSPFAGMNQQNNLMRANAGAATNETTLNFGAAQANSDARLKAAGINAGMYGDYARSMMGEANQQNQFNLQRQGQQNDLMKMLLSGMA